MGDGFGAVDRQETGNVSTVTAVFTNGKENLLSAPVAQANDGNNAATLPSVSQSASPVFTPHFYQRLSHPLSDLLKELPMLDGTDFSLLCDITALRFYLHYLSFFYVLLTVHLSIFLDSDQLDAQLLYFTIRLL